MISAGVPSAAPEISGRVQACGKNPWSCGPCKRVSAARLESICRAAKSRHFGLLPRECCWTTTRTSSSRVRLQRLIRRSTPRRERRRRAAVPAHGDAVPPAAQPAARRERQPAGAPLKQLFLVGLIHVQPSTAAGDTFLELSQPPPRLEWSESMATPPRADAADAERTPTPPAAMSSTATTPRNAGSPCRPARPSTSPPPSPGWRPG